MYILFTISLTTYFLIVYKLTSSQAILSQIVVDMFFYLLIFNCFARQMFCQIGSKIFIPIKSKKGTNSINNQFEHDNTLIWCHQHCVNFCLL